MNDNAPCAISRPRTADLSTCLKTIVCLKSTVHLALLAGLLGITAACMPSGPSVERSAEAPSAKVEPNAASTTTGEVGAAVFDLRKTRLLDLTHPFDAETLYWPTSPSSFELEQLSYGETPGGWFYAANQFSTPEHGGTHLDAPIHFAAGRWTADEIPLQRLSGPAVVIDIRQRTSVDADYLLTLEDVQAWEAEHGQVPAGAIVLLYTGWGQYWPDRASYLGDDTPGDASNLHFPSYGEEAAAYLAETRKVSVLGVDTASIDRGQSTDFLVHRLVNEANIPGLENVANLEQVPATGAWVMALPMKIRGGSGGPVRIVALLP